MTQVDRARLIGAIRAAADFLEEHPEYPTPQTVRLTHMVDSRDEVDEATRVHGAIRWGRANDARLYEGTVGVSATATLASTELLGGASVEYLYFASFDHGPEPKRYLGEGANA